ncbi:MAG: hypothetical protein J5I98_34865 [Phaeodactylibacter sp.]|nr:hypothetical protein [Phaeodactylibacter sp.]
MEEQLDKLEKIHQYLRGELAGQRLADFEAELSRDPKLHQMMEEEQELRAGARFSVEEDMRGRLEKAHREYLEEKAARRGLTRQLLPYGMAAAIGLLLIGFGAGYWLRPGPPLDGLPGTLPPHDVSQAPSEKGPSAPDSQKDIFGEARRSEVLAEKQIRVLRKSENGKTWIPGDRAIGLTIRQHDRRDAIYLFDGNELIIYAPREAGLHIHSLDILELPSGKGAGLYLNVSNQYYELRSSGGAGDSGKEQALKEIDDPEVIRRLSPG